MSVVNYSASANYTYDANGNVRYDSHRGIGYIIYDPSNMPVQAYLTNGQQLVYDNDVNGSRVRNTVSGSSDNFYFNGVDGKTEVVCLSASSTNLTYNILGGGGDNIGQVKVLNKATKRYYYLKDHLGSIKMTVDTTGNNIVGYDDYYPYGLVMTGRSSTSSEDGRYKFTGKELDATEGLYYFGARYYDQWRGGWDQVDPWDYKYPSHSSYNYCKLNPLGLIDSTGKGGGPGDQTDLVSSWFSNTYNSEVTTLSNMAYNTAANFVHWGENATEWGETVGANMSLIGAVGTTATLIIPGLEENTPGFAGMLAGGIILHTGSEIAHVSFLGIDTLSFGGSKTEFATAALKLTIGLTTGAIMNPIQDKIFQGLDPVLKKTMEHISDEIRSFPGL
jgi:RHS repeat-associated protein